MKKTFLFFFILMILSVICIASRVSAATRGISVVSKHGESLYLYNDYQALVVGVSNYELWPKLPNAANDAVEVAKKFKSMGIHVKLVLDPTYRELKTALTDMVYKMGREQNRGVLFYYAGHGETERLADGKNMGYIIPRDCPLLRKDPRGFANHAISMRDIESASLRIRSKHVLMLFDSCFSGALFAMVRAVPHDITEKSTLPVRQYITAGRADEEVPDQSMFKRCLLIGLEGDADLTGDGYVTGSELGMYLADNVVNYTHRQQHPQYGKINNPDLDRGDFVFALKGSGPKKTIAPAKTWAVSQAPAQTQVDLDMILEKIKQKQEEQRRAREALVTKVKELKKDLEKYNQILSVKMDKALELAAWEVMTIKYPHWTQNVKVGDTEQVVQNVLSQDTDGSLRRIFTPQVEVSKREKAVLISQTTVSEPEKQTDKDDRFIAYSDGTVLDTKTNLMWAGSDAGGESFNHSDAESYCEGYRGGGHTDWRMPTLNELVALYNKNVRNEHGYHITKLIDVLADHIWADQSSWGGVAAFSFSTGTPVVGGSTDTSSSYSPYVSARALPVRVRK
jgi:hypothetical protein